MKPRNLKIAMESDQYKVRSIYGMGNKRIRIDLDPRYPNSGHKSCSFWIDSDYFKRNYPKTYSRHLL